MKKRYILQIGALIFVSLAIFMPFVVKAQFGLLDPNAPVTQYMSNPKNIGDVVKAVAAPIIVGANAALGPLAVAIGYIMTTLASIALIFSGFIYDGVIKFTIVDMTKNMGGGSPIGQSISTSWAILRDIANMFFIFVLLYAAFRAMFDSKFSNFGTIVKNIILVALLINFSLFFTRVAVDASNIASIGFYRAISQQSSTTLSGTTDTGKASFEGISSGYMKMLGLQSWYDSNLLEEGFNAQKAMTIGFMSSAFMLIAAVIFLITGIMFAARFIILIFLMILSPLAAIAYIVPGQQGQFNNWLESLKNQLLFPPIFFALTWVSFRLGNNLLKGTLSVTDPNWAKGITSPFENTADTAALLLNFILVIGFSVAALVFSKQVASKTMGFNAVSGGIGTAVVGGAALAGRQTIGRYANKIASDKELQERAKAGDIGARLKLATASKTASSTFDARNIGATRVGKMTGADKLTGGLGTIYGQGGFAAQQKVKDDKKKERVAAQKMLNAREIINKGASAAPGTTAYNDMEIALANLSDKETESLFNVNKSLLKNDAIVGRLSSKQIETLNKSEQLSDTDKSELRNTRFKDIEDIDDAAGIAALAIPATARTPAQSAAAAKVERAIKKAQDLSDNELEMIDSKYFDPNSTKGKQFIENLKSKQVETIGKSKKFTSAQIGGMNQGRKAPLLDALNRNNVSDTEKMIRKLGVKEIASLDIDKLKSQTMLEAFANNIGILKRIVPEMNAANTQDLYDEIINVGSTPGSPATITNLGNWANSPAGQAVFQ